MKKKGKRTLYVRRGEEEEEEKVKFKKEVRGEKGREGESEFSSSSFPLLPT